eukprot:CAMPEP_0184863958 /NCGR_PEP_ID=MMETSP0580-20130426/13070_1 /TAXON_ID=1118495 /ORGANISM="Dactyliosolen fragilissimus" /LENGTH=638 /DNA_ID=CAMNT_0027362557 /DNA_START=114 /DNA_END=2030 /DNA_ORIENTATION=-
MTQSEKFERFEKWLLDNGADFQLLELKAYDDNLTSTPKNKEIEIVEEKKETSLFNKETKCVSEDSEMRGVHAKVNIPVNTVCVSVPRQCLITVEMGQATEIGKAILSSDLDLDAPKHIFLMVFILWDRRANGSKSFFKPYYDILPKTLRNMPIFWSQEELIYLEGSYLLDQIMDRNKAITDDYFAICSIAPELRKIATLEEFKWARMCVCSRNFGLQIDGHRTSALVPHADMLNHYRPRETKWTFDDEKQAFIITTLQEIKAGSQVYDSYGQKCNHRFLLNYGFAVEENTEIDGFCPNEVPIELSIDPNDPIFIEKSDFWMRGEGSTLSRDSITNSSDNVSALAAAVAAAGAARSHTADATAMVESFITSAAMDKRALSHLEDQRKIKRQNDVHVKRVRVCISNNENTRVLFSMLRVLTCNAVELRVISASATPNFCDASCPGYISRALLGISGTHFVGQLSSQHPVLYRTCRDVRHPLNIRNEKASMQLLLNVIGGALNSYPTTLSQDNFDLSDEINFPKFSNRRHAKIQVRGEKEVLHHFAHWARTALEVISVIEKDIAIARGEYQEEDIKMHNGFDSIINTMEKEEDLENGGVHHTIIRYCADVLGAIRRDELKNIRRSRTISGNQINTASSTTI